MGYKGKTILSFVSLLILLLPALGFAASISLNWTANTESDLAGYKVYYGNASRTYRSVVNVGKTTSYTLSNAVGGNTYYLAITAYDTAGNESPYSTEVSAYVQATSTQPPQTAYVTVLTPLNGAILSSAPTLTWKGSGIAKYKAIATLSGKSYYTLYSGTGTSCAFPSSLWSFFIPSGTTVYWYVQGTTSAGQVYKSSVLYFKKR